MLPELQEKLQEIISQIFNTYSAVRKGPGSSVVVLKVHQEIVFCTAQTIFSSVTPLNPSISPCLVLEDALRLNNLPVQYSVLLCC